MDGETLEDYFRHRRQRIIEMRIAGATLGEIGDKYDLTRMRVSQILYEAVELGETTLEEARLTPHKKHNPPEPPAVPPEEKPDVS